MRNAFSDEKAIMVIAPDQDTKLSPDAQEAKIAVCITALPVRSGSAQSDGAQLQKLYENMMTVIDDSGMAQHSETGQYAGVEVTTRKNVTTLTMFASDPETIEHVLISGIEKLHAQKVHTAFEGYRRL